ncbi:MAG: OmpA family protein [Fulvivirga sp.]|nr:OmpA family protein [Fulvivirga sp.]
MGDISFADEVVNFEVGDPAPIEGYGIPEPILGTPDYGGDYEKKYTTLGYGGSRTVKFTDNILYDIEGPDLYIFEIGPDVEPVEVHISKNGEDWISVGKTGGGLSEVDISEYVKKSDIFRYVKIIDVKDSKTGRWPGADVDAIGAIGSSINFQLSSAVLFETGESTLGEDKSALKKIGDKVSEINGLTLIEGYTDNVGSRESNLQLSKKRAEEIKSYLINNHDIDPAKIEVSAYGESNPVATNATEEGRSKNRRVEIIVFPSKNNDESGVTGTWKAGRWGDLHIYRYGNQIAGWYESDGGEILGTFTDPYTIEGKWVENDSGETCDTYVYDRNHWGRLRLEFSEDYSTFTMYWAYCNNPPNKKGLEGTKK